MVSCALLYALCRVNGKDLLYFDRRRNKNVRVWVHYLGSDEAKYQLRSVVGSKLLLIVRQWYQPMCREEGLNHDQA